MLLLYHGLGAGRELWAESSWGILWPGSLGYGRWLRGYWNLLPFPFHLCADLSLHLCYSGWEWNPDTQIQIQMPFGSPSAQDVRPGPVSPPTLHSPPSLPPPLPYSPAVLSVSCWIGLPSVLEGTLGSICCLCELQQTTPPL